MMKPLAVVALTSFAVSVVSFLGAGMMVATAAATPFSFGEILGLGSDRPRCVNELGEAGEQTTTREFAWNVEDEIRLDVSGVLRYRAGAGDSVEVRGPVYLLGHLEFDGENIHYDCSPRGRAQRIEIELASDNIRKFSIRGSGDMVLEDLNEERVEISIAGSGSVIATGEVGRLSLSIAGSGDADLGGLTVRDMEIAIAGSGDAIVSPLGSLEVSIAGSGDIEMLTNPADLDTSIMGSGRVTAPPPQTEFLIHDRIDAGLGAFFVAARRRRAADADGPDNLSVDNDRKSTARVWLAECLTGGHGLRARLRIDRPVIWALSAIAAPVKRFICSNRLI